MYYFNFLRANAQSKKFKFQPSWYNILLYTCWGGVRWSETIGPGSTCVLRHWIMQSTRKLRKKHLHTALLSIKNNMETRPKIWISVIVLSNYANVKPQMPNRLFDRKWDHMKNCEIYSQSSLKMKENFAWTKNAQIKILIYILTILHKWKMHQWKSHEPRIWCIQ